MFLPSNKHPAHFWYVTDTYEQFSVIVLFNTSFVCSNFSGPTYSLSLSRARARARTHTHTQTDKLKVCKLPLRRRNVK